MNKAYQTITNRILELLDEGTVPWQKPWRVEDRPRNLASGRPYYGINAFLLANAPHLSPYYVTYKQAQSRGGHVKRGSKGYPIIFFRWLEKERENTKGKQETYRYPLVKSHVVFNAVDQCEGLKVPQLKTKAFDPVAKAEAIWNEYRDKPTLQLGGFRAFYSPQFDLIQMPSTELLTSASAYYSVLFHEAAHSSGAKHRLDRPGVSKSITAFGSKDYGQEELIAEMTSCYLCGEAGIIDRELSQSSAYINGWLAAIREDKKLVIVAACQAERATNYIRGRYVPERVAS